MCLKKIDLSWPVWLSISIVLWNLDRVNIWTVVLIALSHIHITYNLEERGGKTNETI